MCDAAMLMVYDKSVARYLFDLFNFDRNSCHALKSINVKKSICSGEVSHSLAELLCGG